MKILTVEDNDINAMLMDRLMTELDFPVEHTVIDNGEEAIVESKGNTFDLILMDINLGDGVMNGSEVLKELRHSDHYKNTPIFAITCYALPGDKERFLEEGFSEYISKPIDHQLLLGKITSYKESLKI